MATAVRTSGEEIHTRQRKLTGSNVYGWRELFARPNGYPLLSGGRPARFRRWNTALQILDSSPLFATAITLPEGAEV